MWAAGDDVCIPEHAPQPHPSLVTERWRLDLPELDPATAAIVASRVAFRLAALEHAQAEAEARLVALRAENGVLRSVVDALADRVEADGTVAEETERAALARQAQKLEAVGLLAGGVAHDFNNLLTVILGNAAIARDTLPPDAPVRVELNEILDAARRGAALTRQLLAFGRQQPLEPALVDLHQAARDAGRLLGRLVGVDARLVLEETGGMARVYADPGHVAQVIMNLVLNARDAMRDAMSDGGTITVSTQGGVPVPPDAPSPDASTLPGAAAIRFDATRGALLVVRDMGTGMSAATRARAFEPFFTTKSVGQGTGLGLATVYGIIRQAGGTVWIESAESRGTTVSVWLPGAAGPA